MKDLFVEIIGWEKFQHYKDRRPSWIKNYVDLMRRDDYLDLTPTERALLHGLWLLAGDSPGSRTDAARMRASSLSGATRMRVRRGHLESLEQAGFIRLSASESVAELPKTASRSVPQSKRERTEEPREGTKGPELRLVKDEAPETRERTLGQTGVLEEIVAGLRSSA